jgi:hypothetical protein
MMLLTFAGAIPTEMTHRSICRKDVATPSYCEQGKRYLPRRARIIVSLAAGSLSLGAISRQERCSINTARLWRERFGEHRLGSRHRRLPAAHMKGDANREPLPILKNPKHEKFAQLVASGMTAQAAFTQAGYPSPQNAPRLRNNELVAKKIEELQARNERKGEMAALTRDELVEILTEIVKSTRSPLSEARMEDL